jgi:hypothetical protein
MKGSAPASFAKINGLLKEISSPYEGYPWSGNVLIGGAWIIFTLLLAMIAAARLWKYHLEKEKD